jgi:hypothetical protein
MPQITSLRALYRADGAIDIERTAVDQNLDPTSWKFEIQTQSTAPWQHVSHLECYAGATDGMDSANSLGASRVELRLPAGQSASAVRATVLDRAGNMATYHTNVQPAANGATQGQHATGTAIQALPNANSGTVAAPNLTLNNPFLQGVQPTLSITSPSPESTGVTAITQPLPQGWESRQSVSPPPNAQPAQAVDQPWPATATARGPFRLWSGGPVTQDDAVTSYGNPIGIAPPPIGDDGSNSYSHVVNDSTRQVAPFDPQQASMALSFQPSFQPLGPFRQASVARAGVSLDGPGAPASQSGSQFPSAVSGLPQGGACTQQLPPDVQPKLVGSRTFALEYEIDDAGGQGVSNVELWGTRDGGKTWRAYTRDDDNRSPLVVTVDEEGLFGFRIVVEGSAGTTAARPTAGDLPELWVAVDLQRPTAELTAIEPGIGHMADHLIFRWRAADDNLEPQPISFFYRSHPAGPWSAIATGLENTGEYAWRVERHVPTRFFLRLEVRDTAGNRAAFETRDPIEFAAPAVRGRLLSAEPIDPTATGPSTSYR